ncbi:MAG: NADH-quinone oxidoreductase subunit J [Rhodospirillaceae bacterium]
MVESLVFYLFATALLVAGVMVISARNPVHSVLFLILAFFLGAGLFVLLGAEFLAMTLVIVYVGAVAVLFLFVVMMLDVSFAQMRQGFLRYLPVGGLIGLVLLAELVLVMSHWAKPVALAKPDSPIPPVDQVANAHALGHVLYTQYVYLFQASGLILLIAMVGAIVLTLRSHAHTRHQNISDQINRRAEDVVAIRQVKTGEGI